MLEARQTGSRLSQIEKKYNFTRLYHYCRDQNPSTLSRGNGKCVDVHFCSEFVVNFHVICDNDWTTINFKIESICAETFRFYN